MKKTVFAVFILVVAVLTVLPIEQTKASECFSRDDILADISPPLKYQNASSELLDKLRYSMAHHSPTNRYFDNGFWGVDPKNKCYWPTSFWSGLDKLSLNDLYTLSSVDQKLKKLELWYLVFHVKSIWYGTSYGFKIESSTTGHEELNDLLEDHPSFCKDLAIISNKEHQGQTCYREIGQVGRPGLHICFGTDNPDEIHLDHHQVAIRRIPFSSTCLYDPMAIYTHNKDLAGKTPVTVFDHLSQIHSNAIELKQRLEAQNCQTFVKENLLFMLNEVKDATSKDSLTPIALLGFRGEEKAREIYQKSIKDLSNIAETRSIFCD